MLWWFWDSVAFLWGTVSLKQDQICVAVCDCSSGKSSCLINTGSDGFLSSVGVEIFQEEFRCKCVDHMISLLSYIQLWWRLQLICLLIANKFTQNTDMWRVFCWSATLFPDFGFGNYRHKYWDDCNAINEVHESGTAQDDYTTKNIQNRNTFFFPNKHKNLNKKSPLKTWRNVLQIKTIMWMNVLFRT